MDRTVRSILAVLAAVQAALALGFALQVPVVTALLPFPGVSPLSNTFVASIILAAAASTSWCLWTRSDRALSGISLDYATIFLPATVFAVVKAAGGAGTGVAMFAVAAAAGTLTGLVMLRWSLRQRWRDPRPTPMPVRWAFGVFILALIAVGGLLVLGTPNVLPWQVTPDLSTLFGLMFLGAAVYFVWGLLDPRWENAGGQLAGFLAYDLVLIGPFVARLPTIDPQLRLNLVIYIAVLVGSAAVAIWYLALQPATRVWRRPAAAPAVR